MQAHNIPHSMDEMVRQPQITSPELEALQLQRGGIPNPEQAIITSPPAIIIDDQVHTENAVQGLKARLHGNFKEWFNDRKEIYQHNIAALHEERPNYITFFDEVKHTENARTTLFEKIKYVGINVNAHIRAASHALRGNLMEKAQPVTETPKAKEKIGRSLKVALGVGLVACRGVELAGRAKIYGMPQAVSELMDSLGKLANRKVNGIDLDQSFQFGAEYAEAFIGTQLTKYGIKSSGKLALALKEIAGVAKNLMQDPEETILTPKNLRKATQHL